jgi:flagellin-like protein
MSEKTVLRTERRQAYRRGWRKLTGQQKGISPVVATLILVLIAVAAAAALYIWLIGWQGGVTSTIGKPTVQQGAFTIGGSTSVYPFSEVAVTSFEQNNSGVSISNNQGGTGAGMLAVCAGNVDVGASSSLQTTSGLIASDGCPSSDASTITITTVAYDAVDVIVPVLNDHGLISISYDTLAAIYAGASSTPTSLVWATYNTESTAAVPFDEVPFTTHAALEWYNVPAAVAGAAVCGTTETVSTVAATPGADADGAAGTGACANDIVIPAATDPSPCGFTVCAGPFTAIGTVAATDAVVPVERSDASGTTQTFEARVLGASSATGFATTFAGLGFSGCGSNNLLSDCGISVAHAENGNPGVISYVASNPDAIGYASDGLTRAATSGVTCENVATGACGIGLAYPGEAAGVAPQPSLGASGSIAGGVVNGGFGTPGLTTTVTVANSYAGARPFEYVTLTSPVGLIEQYITWVLDPANNILFAAEAGEVSVYSI